MGGIGDDDSRHFHAKPSTEKKIQNSRKAKFWTLITYGNTGFTNGGVYTIINGNAGVLIENCTISGGNLYMTLVLQLLVQQITVVIS